MIACRTPSGHSRRQRPLERVSDGPGGRGGEKEAKGHDILTRRMYGSKTVSVVFPAYNEEKYIRAAVEDFFIRDVVDEIVVVDNNSRDGTADGSRADAGAGRARNRAGLRQRAAARTARGDRRHHHHGRARWHVHRPRRAEAAGLRRRLRHGVRHAHDARADLGAGQHGLVPAHRQLGGREAAAGAVRRPVAERLRLHAPPDASRRARTLPRSPHRRRIAFSARDGHPRPARRT